MDSAPGSKLQLPNPPVWLLVEDKFWVRRTAKKSEELPVLMEKREGGSGTQRMRLNNPMCPETMVY